MSYCLSPVCRKRENPDNLDSCQSCGSKLLLKERYRTIKPIGGGGFGKTFLAMDEDMPSKQYCVIKQFFYQGNRDIKKAEQLFRQEAVQLEILGKQHSQIPKLLAHFELGSGLYLVQEFIDGQDLLQELEKQGAFDETKIWQLVNNLLPVLKFIHSQQVIHRDIKPENIIRHKSDDKLVLVDFGVSKFATDTNLGITGTAIGTRGYAPPEQWEGKAQFYSDLYALGATCFHLLTKTHPSEVFTPYSNWQKYLKIHLAKSGINDKFKCIVTKLLQPDISERYQSVEEVIQDLHLEEKHINTESPIVFYAPISKPNIEFWTCINTFKSHIWDVLTVAISPDSQILASGSTDHTIKIWNLQTGKLLTTANRSTDIYSISFSPSGKTLVSGSWGHKGQTKIHLWELSTMEVLQTFRGHSGWVNSTAFSPDGQILASGGQNQTIKLWNLNTGKLINTLDKHSGPVNSIAFSPNGTILASGSTDTTIKIWNFATGELLNTFAEHLRSINSVAISPDGQILASDSTDDTIKIWDLGTGELLKTFTGHLQSVNSVAISPNGQFLASGSTDKTIKIWHLGTGELLKTFTGHSASVSSVTFSSNGQFLASGSRDNTIKIWQCDC